jgi:hypothetical protein
VVPALSLSRTAGPPTTKVTVTGTTFGSGEAVDVYFDTSYVQLAVTNDVGVFSATITVPRSAEPDTHFITARRSGAAAQAPFIVRTNWAQFRYGPKHQGRNAFGFRNVDNHRRRIRWACTRQHRRASAAISEAPGQVR